MANPEIDEAAAVEWAGVVLWSETAMAEDKNLALAALAWKARAENLAASPSAQQMIDHLSEQLDTLLAERRALLARAEAAEYAVASAKAWKERGEAAEAERDSLMRQLAQSVKAR